MPSKVTPMASSKLRRKKCAFCPSILKMMATTVCDFGWPDDPCNAPMCTKHTQQVVQDDGKHVREYCPRHKQEIAKVTNA